MQQKTDRPLDIVLPLDLSRFLTKNLPSNKWHDIAVQLLCGATSRLEWLWAQWWVFGETNYAYGERRRIVSADDWIGPSYERLMNMASVYRRFPETSRRREVLSFQHHAEVAALGAATAAELLDWCLEEIAERGQPRSTRELRDKIREHGRETMQRAIAAARQPSRHNIPSGAGPTVLRIVTTAREDPRPPQSTVYQLSIARPGRDEPEPALDNSPADGSVSPELATLKEESERPDEQIKEIEKALDALPLDDRAQLLIDGVLALPFDQIAEALKVCVFALSAGQPGGRRDDRVDPLPVERYIEMLRGCVDGLPVAKRVEMLADCADALPVAKADELLAKFAAKRGYRLEPISESPHNALTRRRWPGGHKPARPRALRAGEESH